MIIELRSFFEPHIFSRGRVYFRTGAVGKIKITPQSAGPVHVQASVRGSRTYRTDILFSPEDGTFMTFDCSCPYDDYCKHAAALGLMFIEHYADPGEAGRGVNAPILEDTIASILRGDAAAASDIDRIIEQLQQVKKRTQTAAFSRDTLHGSRSITSVPIQKDAASALGEYYLVISRWDGNVSLHHRSNPYQMASVAKLLKRSDLEAKAREMLELTKSAQSKSPHGVDLGRLCILAQEVGIKMYSENEYRWGVKVKPLVVEPAPKKISATLRFEEYHSESAGRVRPRFTFTFYPKDINEDTYSFIASTNHLIRIGKDTIALYSMSGRLARCIADMLRHHRYTNTFALADRDTIHINDIMTAAKEALDLTCVLKDYAIERYTNPKKVLVVDLKNDEEVLAIYACVDYWFTQIDVTESVMISNSGGGKTFKRRNNPYGDADTHIIEFDGQTIRAAPIDEKMEETLVADLYDKGVLPNMKPRATIKKFSNIFYFYNTYWQKLEKYCCTIGCEIRFPHDRFAFSEGNFRADFSVDIHEKNDWLAFDATCYLGEDKVTLDDIRRLLSEEKEFFRHADGRILRITNREELARFVAMLRRFAEREGRFEGRLYNAPELQYIVTSSPYYNAQQSEGFDAFCKAMKQGKPVKRVALTASHRRILRPYQRAGVEWLYFLRSYHFAGILADDMGLGKTVQTLILLERERVEKTPSLVICPKSLLYNWQAEAARFTPALNVAVVDGTPTERAEIIKNAKRYDVLVTGYATYKIDAPAYKKWNIKFNYCVLDEAQFIKNHATKNAQIIKEVDAQWRLALTGTPLENNVSEIWSMFDFLMPGFLGTHKEFSEHFHTPIMKRGDTEALTHLRKKVECFMLRRIKEEVLAELPPKVVQDSRCHLSAAQNLLYQEVLARVKQEIWETVASKGFDRSGIHILAGLTKLRQVCNHPNLLLKERDHTAHPSAKLDMFHELIEEVSENKRKVLVFSQFTAMLDILALELKAKNISYSYLSGKTRNRQKMVDTFNNDPAIPVFLISLKAGGTGLNLTTADMVIIFDPWWNPSVENQAIDRAHRIGQKRSVNVHKLITSGTIEEKIIALQNKKKNLFDSVVGESKDIFKKLTWDDIQDLFR